MEVLAPQGHATSLGTPSFDVVVDTRRDEADGVVGLTLALPSGLRLPAFSPGAHIDLVMPNGVTRQYSLCGRPEDGTWRIAVLEERASRGGSAWIHANAWPGVTLRVAGPRNNFPLLAAPRYLFIAGGIGITPILPMVREVARARVKWMLWYGGRRRSSMAFLDELPDRGSVRVHPEDESGMLDLDLILGAPEPDTLVYCCGPAGLIEAVERRCGVWPPNSLHVERFQAKAPDADVADHAIEVECARSGVTVRVPEGVSILAALEEAGLPVISSCQEGVCGTCETGVLEGRPDHRDSVLSDEERASNRTMTICVSRCLDRRLVLDV